MRRFSILALSLSLLSWLGAVPHCSGMQLRPDPKVTLQVKDASFSARNTALVSDASELDLLQKGYVVIGRVSADWRLAPSEIDQSRQTPAPAVVAEAKQVMAKAAAASGGDLIRLPQSEVDRDFDKTSVERCHDVTIPGKETVITTYKRDGSFEQRHVSGKPKTETVCKLEEGTDFNKPFYSLKAAAAVWRLEPEMARQLIAASEGNEAAIQAAEAKGFAVPRSSLFMAIETGDISRVTQLLNRGARLNVLLPDGQDPTNEYRQRATPLHWAAFANQTQVARLLLDRGADVNARDNADKTPLQYALWDDKYLFKEKSGPMAELATLLLTHGANPNVYDKDHHTPLYGAIRGANVEMVRVLLEHGADPSLKDGSGSSGQTALGVAKAWRKVTFDSEHRSQFSDGNSQVPQLDQIIALLSSPAVSADTSGWKRYSYAEDRFSITSPFKPDFKEVSQGYLETHNYNITLDGGRSLLLSVTDTGQGDRLKPKRALATARDSFAKNLNVKVISEKEIRLAEHPGIEFEAQGTQWHVRCRIYAVGGVFFHLFSIGPANTPVAPETDRVFDSLALFESK
jgi:Ankyrin repeats (3 copies)/Ankyrin repeats (many copies)